MKIKLKNGYEFEADNVLEAAQPNVTIDGSITNMVYYLTIQGNNIVSISELSENIVTENLDEIYVINENNQEVKYKSYTDVIAISASMQGGNYFLDIRLRKPPEPLVSGYFKTEYNKLKEIIENVEFGE